MSNKNDRSQITIYLLSVTIRYLWLLAIVFLLINIFFKPFINIIAVTAVAGLIYSGWLKHKDRFMLQLFIEEDYVPKENKVIYAVSFVELLVLVVGLHFLFKGFTTVTGINEGLFKTSLTKKGIPVAFLLAAAVVLGMLIMLFLIKRSRTYTKLVVIYVIVDILILFPYNFIFSYENCLNDNITHYYSAAMPPLFYTLNDRVSKKESTALLKLSPVKEQNANWNAVAGRCDTAIRLENDRYVAKNTSGYSDDQLLKFRQAHYGTIRRYTDEKNAALRKVNPLEYSLSTQANLFTGMDIKLKGIAGTISAIHDNKIADDSLYSVVQNLKVTFIQIFNADSLLMRDTVITKQVAKLQVVPELPTDGFFNLLKDLFGWALKDQYATHQVSVPRKNDLADVLAQADWDQQVPQKRYFSFLFAILIDLFPMIITMAYIHFTKNRRQTVSDD